MVHVKTVKGKNPSVIWNLLYNDTDNVFAEYEIQQDVICLFSDTLQRAITNQMITQDMVDFYDPRFAIL